MYVTQDEVLFDLQLLVRHFVFSFVHELLMFQMQIHL